MTIGYMKSGGVHVLFCRNAYFIFSQEHMSHLQQENFGGMVQNIVQS